MSIETKEQAVRNAIRDLFDDTSVAQEETAAVLETIIDEIREMISTLDV